jgi:hypothetical protein
MLKIALGARSRLIVDIGRVGDMLEENGWDDALRGHVMNA